MAKKSELLKVGSKEDALSGGLRKYNEREGCFIRLIVKENMLHLGKMSRRKKNVTMNTLILSSFIYPHLFMLL